MLHVGHAWSSELPQFKQNFAPMGLSLSQCPQFTYPAYRYEAAVRPRWMSNPDGFRGADAASDHLRYRWRLEEFVAKPAIVAVDDDPQVAAAVARDLRGRYAAEYRIVTANSGAEALSALESLQSRGNTVALLLADQRMPEDGGN